MATINALVAKARRRLRGSKREPFRLLSEAVPSGQTFLRLTAPPSKVQVDDYLCLGAEILVVTSVDEEQNQLNVLRGVDDTPQPTTHAAGTRVEINWRWFTADLLDHLTDEIRSWGDGIYGVKDVTVSLGATSRAVDLPLTRFLWPLELRQKVSTRAWKTVPARSFRVEQGLPTSEFASGNALILPRQSFASTLILTYAQSFDVSAVDSLTTDLATVGITERLHDAAFYGIAWRALSSEESSRLDDGSQPEPRAADEVEPGDQMRAASAYKAIRDLRLEEEKRRLRTLYPMKVA